MEDTRSRLFRYYEILVLFRLCMHKRVGNTRVDCEETPLMKLTVPGSTKIQSTFSAGSLPGPRYGIYNMMSANFDALPTQIFSLFKLLSYPNVGDIHGDGMDLAFTRVPTKGRTIVDCGLHDCNSLIAMVKSGFLVHGFEPVASHMANCHRQLSSHQYLNVDVSSPTAVEAARQRRHYKRAAAMRAPLLEGNATGFAFLYQAAVGNASGTMPIFGRGGSTTLTSAGDVGRKPQAGAQVVPVVRLEDFVHEDVWLLKMDLQGYEWHAISGATALFARHTVAHIFTEYTPRLLQQAGVRPGALVDLLKRNGMMCFDVRNGDGPRTAKQESQVAAPWALPRSHPLPIQEYLLAMRANDEHGSRVSETGRVGKSAIWQHKYGSFDDLACVNIAKAWNQSFQYSV